MANRANTGASVQPTRSEPRKPIVIESFKTIEVYKNPQLLISAKVCKIDGRSFVGLDKFWCELYSKQWKPSKKGHFYVTPEQWRYFAQCVPALTQALNGMEKQMRNSYASSGMRTFEQLPLQ